MPVLLPQFVRAATLLLALVVAAGCAGPDRAGTAPSSSTGPSAGGQPTPEPAGSGSAAPGAALQQTWATATLIDVTSGESFRIADLVAGGKVVFVETIAIWCTSCRAQQYEAVAAFERLDPARVVWVAIDVEQSESADALAAYRKSNGFPFTYVIAGADLSRALAADFGDVILSPPSGNVIVIGTDGRVTRTHSGHKSADELIALARDHGA